MMNNMIIARDTENQIVFFTDKSFSHEYPDTEFYTKQVADRLVQILEDQADKSYCDIQAITKREYDRRFC